MAIVFFLPLFFLATLLAFYIPGNIFVSHIKTSTLQKIALSVSFGLVLFALQGFIFGYLHVRWMTYLYLFIMLLVWLKQNRHKILLYRISFVKPKSDNLLLGIFLGFAVLTQLLTISANGITTTNGIYFCCGLPDSLFHIALTNDLIYNFPPHEPGVSEQILSNYHFLSNLVNADIIRIFHLPLLYVQYPYMSLLITFLFALNILVFAQLVTKKKAYAYWLLFFVFFSGDLLFVLIFIRTHVINFNTSILEHASTLWYSPPRVYAAMVLFTGMNFLTLWIREKKNIYLDILLICTLGSLIEFKVYFGIFALFGLAALVPFYIKEKNKHKIFIILLTFLMSMGLYLPINSGAGGFIFTGFWLFDNFASNNALGLHQMELARYVYIAHGNWLHALLNDLIYFILYFVFIFGTLLLSLFQTRKSLSLLDTKLNIFLIAGLFVSFVFGSFFIQQTGGANTAQFLITDMIMLSIYTALAVIYWLNKIKRKELVVLAIFIIVALTAQRVIHESYKMFTVILYQKGLLLNTNELAALNYLKNNTPSDSIILQSELDHCLPITFIAQRQTYICLDATPDQHGETLDKRITLQRNFFQIQKNNKKTAKIMAQLRHEKNVDYIYLPTILYQEHMKIYKKYGFVKRYGNEEITILYR